MQSRDATAVLTLAGAHELASFEAAGLEVRSVTLHDRPVPYRHDGLALHVGVPASPEPLALTVRYRFADPADYGWKSGEHGPLLWPDLCGQVFPCRSSPAEGQRFALALEGVPAGWSAIYPARIELDAPAYVLSWALGAYEHRDLGQTPAGTRLSLWLTPALRAAGAKGTASLVAAFAWAERVLGPYPYGDHAGSVAMAWDGVPFGGMEHHPFWHVAARQFGDDETHVHEALHGWFGNGVRLRCWEDLVLSEGTTSWLSVEALREAAGAERAERLWRSFERRLQRAVASRDQVVWPEGCGETDARRLFHDVTYMKGAFFLQAVAERTDTDGLLAALATFYRERRGTAAGVADLLEHIRRETGFDPRPLAEAWLRSRGIPGHTRSTAQPPR